MPKISFLSRQGGSLSASKGTYKEDEMEGDVAALKEQLCGFLMVLMDVGGRP